MSCLTFTASYNLLLVAAKFSAEEWQAQSQRALAQLSNMAYNDEERTESATETRRVENPDSMVSGHDKEERRREDQERHRGESQNRGIHSD